MNVFCFSNWGYVTHISAAPSAIGSSAQIQGSPTRSDVPTAPVVLQRHSNAGIGCKRWCSLPRSENLRATRANTYYDYETAHHPTISNIYCSSWWDTKKWRQGRRYSEPNCWVHATRSHWGFGFPSPQKVVLRDTDGRTLGVYVFLKSNHGSSDQRNNLGRY